MNFKFFSPRVPTSASQNRLPHWEQSGGAYFVTFRLADALPAELLRGWEFERSAWLRHHPEPWTREVEREYHQRFSGAIERWLDEGRGECLLREPAAARIVGNALEHFNGERYDQLCWVVMPNHVHVICAPKDPRPLREIVHAWKSFTAHALNKHFERRGAVWQKDYFDRLVRDQDHLARIIHYIRDNPRKAKLPERAFLLWESDFAKAF